MIDLFATHTSYYIEKLVDLEIHAELKTKMEGVAWWRRYICRSSYVMA
jgi:hypothetical protein